METKRPLILISNDDGITSRGIAMLVDIMSEIGDVVVVAPNSPQSGMGHAITISGPLRLDKSTVFSHLSGSWECSGTPADCIKLAKHHVLRDRRPDLVVSGINHGSNSSISVLYSGTMSAAIEAAIEGLPAIGFSLCDYSPDAELGHVRPFIKQITEQALAQGIPVGIALNVNLPSAASGPIKGIRFCRQSRAKWQEKFDERTDPYGRSYFWLTGIFNNMDKGEDTDEWALANGYVSVVPCQFDMTAYHVLPLLNKDWDVK